MIRLQALCVAFGLAADPVLGLDLALPQGARQISERVSALDSYALPIGPFSGAGVPVRPIEGRIERQTWRIETPGLTTLQVLDPLRDQLESDGFDLIYQCRDTECGGFDFRFKTEVVPAPDMYVDIRNYRFVAAMRDIDEAISLLVSRSRSTAYVQIIYVNRDTRSNIVTNEPETGVPVEVAPVSPRTLAQTLQARGHVVLDDLVFDTGADALDPGRYDSLEQLAAYLTENPGIVIALVGHTDSIGPLDRNISLSKRRAQSVRTRLVDSYGIAPERIEAEGMGYLSPLASNLTPEGREANRRVEAILLADN